MVSSVLISADMIHNGEITLQILQLSLTDAWQRTEIEVLLSCLNTIPYYHRALSLLSVASSSHSSRIRVFTTLMHLNLKIKRVHTHAVHERIKKFAPTHTTLASPDIIDMAWL